MRTTLDLDTRMLDELRRKGGYASRKDVMADALLNLRRRLALAELADDIGRHAKAFRRGYDPEAEER